MKKAQLQGQVFIYILTILVISFILIYGYNAISNFRSRTNQIIYLKLGEDLKSSVQRITPDFGSVLKKEIDAGAASQICFVENFQYVGNRNSPAGKNSDGANIPVNPVIKDSIKSSSGEVSDKNVFLIGKSILYSFSIGYIKVDESASPAAHFNVLCIPPVNGKIILKMEGMGDHTLISKWT